MYRQIADAYHIALVVAPMARVQVPISVCARWASLRTEALKAVNLALPPYHRYNYLQAVKPTPLQNVMFNII